jgi:hypothetical protein
VEADKIELFRKLSPEPEEREMVCEFGIPHSNTESRTPLNRRCPPKGVKESSSPQGSGSTFRRPKAKDAFAGREFNHANKFARDSWHGLGLKKEAAGCGFVEISRNVKDGLV